MDGLVDTEMLQESVIRPLLLDSFPQEKAAIEQYVIESADWKWIDTMENAMTGVFIWKYRVVSGWRSESNFVLSKSFPTRGVQNAENQEVAIVGAKTVLQKV